MSCCTTYIDLGCATSCEAIDTGLTATVGGTHKIVFDWIMGTRTVNAAFGVGDSIEIPGLVFNEFSTTIFRVKDPDGSYMELSDTECFQVETTPGSGDITVSTSGLDTCTLTVEEFQNLDSGNTVTLSQSATTVYLVFRNGVAQHDDEWDVSGSTVTFPLRNFADGEEVKVFYC